MNETKKKILLVAATILLLAAVTSVYAAHYHSWSKMSETIVQDRWGASVHQCMWVCDSYDGGRHTTVTQGRSWCPRP